MHTAQGAAYRVRWCKSGVRQPADTKKPPNRSSEAICAPEGTRTPNLLIRSQMRISGVRDQVMPAGSEAMLAESDANRHSAHPAFCVPASGWDRRVAIDTTVRPNATVSSSPPPYAAIGPDHHPASSSASAWASASARRRSVQTRVAHEAVTIRSSTAKADGHPISWVMTWTPALMRAPMASRARTTASRRPGRQVDVVWRGMVGLRSANRARGWSVLVAPPTGWAWAPVTRCCRTPAPAGAERITRPLNQNERLLAHPCVRSQARTGRKVSTGGPMGVRGGAARSATWGPDVRIRCPVADRPSGAGRGRLR